MVENGKTKATILVTGAGGYIGTTLVPMLLAEGYRVRALDRFFFGRELLESHPHLEVVQEDARQMKAEHLNGVDYVIDLVAISNDPSGEQFKQETIAINRDARVTTAKLAKAAGVKRYILPSSCSIYGFQPADVIATEKTKTNPLTTYANANEMAEQAVLPLASDDFVCVVLRQATVYGFSPRMRFDLAINGMTFGAWKTGVLPLDARRHAVAADDPRKGHRACADFHADGGRRARSTARSSMSDRKRTIINWGRWRSALPRPSSRLPRATSRSNGTASPITVPTASISTR